MTRTAASKGKGASSLLGFALTTALAGATLASCAASAPPAAISASKAQASLAQGNYTRAIGHAEAAVLAEPRNGSYRAMLGAAYLEAGRFASAATAFQDAIELGDTSPRTALSLALALIAEGKQPAAQKVLAEWEQLIGRGDLGLAYALAGLPDRGIQILSTALREGENSSKIRQNLAYSYALAGRWKEARLMASEDIPADRVGDRMAQWATQVHPALYRARVASLLSVPDSVVDPGQPVQLALANFPNVDQLALDAARSAPAAAAPAGPQASAPQPAVATTAAGQAPAGLLPIGDPVDPRAAPAPQPPARTTMVARHDAAGTVAFQPPARTSIAPSTAVPAASRTVQQEVVQPLPSRTAAAPTVAAGSPALPLPASAQSGAGQGTHLVQLGSFSSEKGARRAWSIYVQRYPELAGHDMVITRAVVRGKEYYRVAAAGYDASSSRAMCGRVNRASNEGCIAHAANRPLPGAVDQGRRFAMR